MSEEKIRKLIEEMLQHTGPVLSINEFKKFPALDAPQTLRNRLSAGEVPREFFFKNGRATMVYMTLYLPFWAKGFTSHTPGKQIGKQ
jgi:hypothetical protein